MTHSSAVDLIYGLPPLQLMRRARRRLLFCFGGIEAMSRELRKTWNPAEVLRQFGAQVGTDPVIEGPLIVHNAARDFSNLAVGEHVHIGRQVLLDLADRVEICDQATVSMGVTVLTHTDVGDRPLADRLPRMTAPTRVGAAAYVGANATLLAGCAIGARAVVGAGAVVTKPVGEAVTVVGVPARAVG